MKIWVTPSLPSPSTRAIGITCSSLESKPFFSTRERSLLNAAVILYTIPPDAPWYWSPPIKASGAIQTISCDDYEGPSGYSLVYWKCFKEVLMTSYSNYAHPRQACSANSFYFADIAKKEIAKAWLTQNFWNKEKEWRKDLTYLSRGACVHSES